MNTRVLGIALMFLVACTPASAICCSGKVVVKRICQIDRREAYVHPASYEKREALISGPEACCVNC